KERRYESESNLLRREHACDGAPIGPNASVCPVRGDLFRDSEHNYRPDRWSTHRHQPDPHVDPKDGATGAVARHIDHPGAELYLDDQGQLSRLDESGVRTARK